MDWDVCIASELEDGPRERLMRLGPGALRVDELLACIMQSGNGKQNVYESRSRCVGIWAISTGSRSRGCGAAQRSWHRTRQGRPDCRRRRIGRRVARKPPGERRQIRTAEDAAKYVMDRLRYLKKEHFVTLLLDTKHRVLAEDTSSVGSLDASIYIRARSFRRAIRISASSILCIHNHPSGDPSPSPEDIAVTKRLVEAGRVLGIEVLDHIVIGDGRFVSLRAEGYLDSIG